MTPLCWLLELPIWFRDDEELHEEFAIARSLPAALDALIALDIMRLPWGRPCPGSVLVQVAKSYFLLLDIRQFLAVWTKALWFNPRILFYYPVGCYKVQRTEPEVQATKV